VINMKKKKERERNKEEFCYAILRELQTVSSPCSLVVVVEQERRASSSSGFKTLSRYMVADAPLVTGPYYLYK